MRARLRGATALAVGALLPAVALAQARVTALTEGLDPLEASDQLRLSRFADFSEETTVAVGAELEVGDLLSSLSEVLAVELACGAATLLRFSGGFRLLIEDAEQADCAIDLLSGSVDALTEEPVQIGAGDVTLGVEGTQLALTLSRGEDGGERDLSVFEGRVWVRSGATEQEVGTGRTWTKAAGEARWGEVTESRAERTASLFARLEVAKSAASGQELPDREGSYEELRRLYLGVLTRPEDADTRRELARTQLRYEREDTAAYHLRRAGATAVELEGYGIEPRIPPLDPDDAGGSARPRPADPFELLAAGEYRAAIERLEELAASGPSSRVYYGLARAWTGLEGTAGAKARAYAVRALRLDDTDRGLAERERTWCRQTAGGS